MAHDLNQNYPDYFTNTNTNTAMMQAMEASQHELYNLQAGIEMLGMRGFATPTHDPMSILNMHNNNSNSSNNNNQGSLSLSLHQNPDFFPSSRNITSTGFYQHSSWHLRSSRFLVPAQELLQEFCCLPVDEITSISSKHKKAVVNKSNNWEEGGSSSSSSPWKQTQPIQTMDVLELKKLKAKLYSMLEEVDRRYRRYCEQMRALVSSFESVAGERVAAAYTTLASKTISRHFRSLRDGIVSQIHAAKKALGEKDIAVPGTTRGETPRLKLLDQCIRQQKALHQSGIMESPPWRPQRGLPERAVSVLRAWLFEHFLHPYPSEVDKHILSRQTGLSRSQVSNWFINARVRLWKPMVEEMYLEEMKDQENASNPRPNPNTDSSAANIGDMIDQKPTQAQLLHDQGSLASILNIGDRGGNVARQNYSLVMDDPLDFDPYDQCGSQSFNTGVSLTLGLQQHDARGMDMSQGGMLFSGGHTHNNMEAVHSGNEQFGAASLEGEAVQNVQLHNNYRSLSSGVQLLHDLAG